MLIQEQLKKQLITPYISPINLYIRHLKKTLQSRGFWDQLIFFSPTFSNSIHLSVFKGGYTNKE